jgi:NADP-dependent aldehyde dehydrogenase
MTLHGKQIISGKPAAAGSSTFKAFNPAENRELPAPFFEATAQEVDQSLRQACTAFKTYQKTEPQARAAFIRNICTEIESLGESLIELANSETALGVERLRGERGRTVTQLRMFADLIEEGSWVDARIDLPNPDRKPLPKPDVRRMLIPLGPVVVFGASNFPLAFSVAGGDTASALAAGCPVVVKAHPAHPSTSELVATAIATAVEKSAMPPGVFSMLQGRAPELSISLVKHPATAAVGFTGSLRAGRALFAAAAARPRPIPVYAEMGSANPLFVLPGALAERGDQIAAGLKNSVTLGVGQFCTKPGIVVGLDDPQTAKFAESFCTLMKQAPAGVLLHAGIQSAYVKGVKEVGQISGVKTTTSESSGATIGATPAVFLTSDDAFLANPRLGEELFGPSTVLVTASSREQLLGIAHRLEGHLTATIHGTAEDLANYADLVDILQQRVGRLIFNGFPTGVEVCAAMQHGGPYPATSDPRTTSVGTAAIERFVRPVAFQGFPQSSLPPELRNDNPRNIWRLVDNKLSHDKIG